MRHTAEEIQTECDRQLQLLALAHLSINRPGFAAAAAAIAEQMEGGEEFEHFRLLCIGSDRPPAPPPLITEREERALISSVAAYLTRRP